MQEDVARMATPSHMESDQSVARTSVFYLPARLVGIGLFALASVIGVIGAFMGVPLADLVRDPAATFKYPSYIGLFSHIGIVLMVSTAAVTGFAALVLSHSKNGNAPLLFGVSLLSFLLVPDDIFMLHEQASRLGEVAIFACYGVLGLAVWFGLKRASDVYDLRGFKVALFFMGLSVFTDIFKIYGPFAHWLEYFSKLSGFGAWLTFWIGFSRKSIVTGVSASA